MGVIDGLRGTAFFSGQAGGSGKMLFTPFKNGRDNDYTGN
jgi:hypothetical protein